MGSKHNPPRWWRDYDAEITAWNLRDVIARTIEGDVEYVLKEDGTHVYTNLKTGAILTLGPLYFLGKVPDGWKADLLHIPIGCGKVTEPEF
jgi:hypothetical protein